MPQDKPKQEPKQESRLPPFGPGKDTVRPMSVGGFIENVGTDAFDVLKGIYSIIPTIGNSAAQIAKDADYIPTMLSNPETITKSFGDTAVAMKDAIIEPYQKHGAKVLYERPMSTLLDALTILDLGATSIGKVGAITKSERLMKLAKEAKELPAKLARGAIDLAVLKGTRGKINLPQGRLVAHERREARAAALKKADLDLQTYDRAIKALNDDEAALFHKVRTQGASIAEMQQAPKVARAYESYQKLVQGWQEYLKEIGVLDDRRIRVALIKKYMAETGADAKAAIAAIDAAEVKPIYGKAMTGEGKLRDLEELFSAPEVQRTGKVGFLEKFTGNQRNVRDPRVYVASSIKAFRDFEGRINFIDRLISQAEKFGIKAGKAGEIPLKEILPEGVFKKYFSDRSRAGSVAYRDLVAKHGAAEAGRLAASDLATQKMLAQARNMTGSPTLQRLLRWEFTTVNHPLLRFYDKVLNLFRLSATKFNPAYYTGNAIGDAVFGVLGGADAVRGAELAKAGKMPAEATHVWHMGGLKTELGGFLSNVPDLANEADKAVRVGLITRAMTDELVKTGLSREAAQKAVEVTLKATANYHEMETVIQRAMENAVKSSTKIRQLDREITSLSRKEQELASLGQVTPELGAVRADLNTKIALRDNLARDIADDMMRVDPMLQKSAELQKDVAITRRGVEVANMFIGDYLGLNGFEQGVARRLIPFYPFMNAMTALAFRLPFYAPVKTFLWHRYAMAAWSMVGDKELPEYMNGYVPVFARANGELVWMKLTRYSPFNSLKMKEFGQMPIPSLFAFWDQNPFISLGFKLIGGKTVFDKTSIPYGETMVNITNGDVYEYTEDGKIRKTIPQAPFVASVAHMFPITQLVEDIILPYRANGYNVVGMPEPALNPDGSYKHPRELWQRIGAAAGLNFMNRSREGVIRSEKIRLHQVLKAMRSAYRRASPEERAMFVQAFRDYSKGQLRIDND